LSLFAWLLLFSTLGAEVKVKTHPLKKEEASLKNVEAVQNLSGSHSLGGEVFDTVTSSGLLKLNGTRIHQRLHVSGSLLAQSARMGALEVYGEANLSQSTVTQPSTIVGYLRAQGTHFEAPLTLGAHKAVFTACHINSITIRKEEGFKAKQIIELKQKTIVNGDITFESDRGEVYLYPGSQVLGKIIGGKLVRKN
jgi:hypothetical protein